MDRSVVEKTYIKGKDACLEDTIEKMQSILKSSGFDIQQASWQNPVPNVYSLHIKDAFCPALFTNGKGASKKATLASALGEFFERLETNYFFSDFWLGETAEGDWLYYPDEKSFEMADYREMLSPELWQIYDPEDELEAADFLSLNDSRHQIRCLPMKQEATGKSVDFPINLFSNLYASNGLCAGNTELEAKVQGLSEVFERWVKGRILKENICLPVVPESRLKNLPQVLEARQALQEKGLFVSIRDASLGGQFPVMNVTLFDQNTGQCFASFGAHPIFEVALERTLTESLQGRSLDLLEGFQLPVFDQALVAEAENIENHFIDSSGLIHAHFVSHDNDFEFVPWNFEGDTAAQWQMLVNKIQQQGAEVYSANYNHYGVHSARVIVPGMSEVYPMEELLNANQNQGRVLREALETLESSAKTAEDFQILLEEVDYLGFSDHQNVANLIGLLQDEDSLWKVFKVVDLKLSAAIASGQLDLAADYLHDALYYVDSPELSQKYRALGFVLEVINQDLLGSLGKEVQEEMFGQALTEQIWLNIEAEAFFWGLPIGRQQFENSQKHQKLLQVYQRTRDVKQQVK